MLPNITEVARLQSPAPFPQGVAFDGTSLWLASCKTFSLYAIDPQSWIVRNEVTAPGEPFGLTISGDEMRVVLGFGEDADDRFIYRFTPGQGFAECFPCPDLSGAYLAFDGRTLLLAQAHNMRLLALDAGGEVINHIALSRRPVGMTIVDGDLYILSTDENFENAQLGKMKADLTSSALETVAAVSFAARGLAFDGSRFWTAHRRNNEVVAFHLVTSATV